MPRKMIVRSAFAAPLLLVLAACGEEAAAPADPAFRIKREAVYAFAQPPALSAAGDRVTIVFETQGFCDVTVAIENAEQRIVRHLACGVLGENAPPPLQKDSKKQTLVWDGKDDEGKYIDDKASHAVRVSLGMKHEFERNVLWAPQKRWGAQTPLIQAAPEGVYVYDDGEGVAQLRLFDHDGNYVKTVYPFPAEQLESFAGVPWRTAPQDGVRVALKRGGTQSTLLSSGTDSDFDGEMGVGRKHSIPHPAKALAVRDGAVALAYVKLNRFTTAGSQGAGGLEGPATSYRVVRGGRPHLGGGQEIDVGPRRAALSPGNKWLYLTAFDWDEGHGTGGTQFHQFHGVSRLPYGGEGKMDVFAGEMKPRADGAGKDAARFKVPADVACDAQGRVYVCDYMNDRIQAFAEDGKLLKSIASNKPVRLAVHPKTGELFVFSWYLKDMLVFAEKRDREFVFSPSLTVLKSFDDPRPATHCELPLLNHPKNIGGMGEKYGGRQYEAALDAWTDPPAVWLVPDAPVWGNDPWSRTGIRIYAFAGGKLELKRDFGAEASKALARATPPNLLRQRMYANPADGRLYIAEGDAGTGKSSKQLLAVDPASGRVETVELPFDAEDIAFDAHGLVYLRALRDVVRYEPKTWREVPWDYGEERGTVGFSGSQGRRAPAISSLPLPVQRFNHHGGMMVSASGHLVVGIHGGQEPEGDRRSETVAQADAGNAYSFNLYPGRSTAGLVLVFDRYGKIVYDDALPGIAFMHGIGIDRDDSLYVMAMAARNFGAKPYPNLATDTLVKVRPRKAKVYATMATFTPVPLTPERRPQRPADLLTGGGGRLKSAWIEDAEWFYGGVGYHDRHSKSEGFGCDCSNARFDLDRFARSFVPEVDRCSVAVLDSAGNLIDRIGSYGNVDDPGLRLFYAPYVAADTDRRLFVADPGNQRIAAVKLGYHEEKRLPLRATEE